MEEEEAVEEEAAVAVLARQTSRGHTPLFLAVANLTASLRYGEVGLDRVGWDEMEVE